MKLHQLYVDLVANPFAPRVYRELARHYEDAGRPNEAAAFWHALSVKFGEKNDNDTRGDSEQRGDDPGVP